MGIRTVRQPRPQSNPRGTLDKFVEGTARIALGTRQVKDVRAPEKSETRLLFFSFLLQSRFDVEGVLDYPEKECK